MRRPGHSRDLVCLVSRFEPEQLAFFDVFLGRLMYYHYTTDANVDLQFV